MQTPLLFPLFTIILMVSPSSCGQVNSQMWSGAFKPIGLNTIIRNRCLAEDWRGVVHQRGREEGEEVAVPDPTATGLRVSRRVRCAADTMDDQEYVLRQSGLSSGLQ